MFMYLSVSRIFCSICLFVCLASITHNLNYCKMKMLVAQLCPTLCDPVCGLQSARLLCPWDSPGKNTGVGCLTLFQVSFPPRDQNWGSRMAGRFFTI